MKKKIKKKYEIILFSTIGILLFGMSLFLNRNLGMVEGYLKDGSVFIQKILLYPVTSFQEDKKEVKSESYLIQKNVNESLEKEIEELKKH